MLNWKREIINGQVKENARPDHGRIDLCLIMETWFIEKGGERKKRSRREKEISWWYNGNFRLAKEH